MMIASAAGLPLFFLYFGVGLALTVVFAAVYMWITPQDELALIRDGNMSAAVAFGGNLAGFSIPLDKAISQAGSVLDCVLWAFVALVVQFVVYFAVKALIPDLSKKIEDDNLAVAIFLAFISIVSGMLNAASMTLSPT